jgi:hypothetical protein
MISSLSKGISKQVRNLGMTNLKVTLKVRARRQIDAMDVHFMIAEINTVIVHSSS